jgi:hypothetical protein
VVMYPDRHQTRSVRHEPRSFRPRHRFRGCHR